MKAKSYLDKRTELLPGTRTSLFVTDGWRGKRGGWRGGGGPRRRGRSFACSYAIREIERCLCVSSGGGRGRDGSRTDRTPEYPSLCR